MVAAVSSFVMFALGAIIPLLPYLFGSESLWAGLLCSAVGLLVPGAASAKFTKGALWFGAGRQLAFGAIAIAATYAVGNLVEAVL